MATIPKWMSAIGIGCGACDIHLGSDSVYIDVPCPRHRRRERELFNAIEKLSKTLMPSNRDRRINFVNKCCEVYSHSYVYRDEPAAIQRLTDIIHQEGFTTSRYDAMKIATETFSATSID